MSSYNFASGLCLSTYLYSKMNSFLLITGASMKHITCTLSDLASRLVILNVSASGSMFLSDYSLQWLMVRNLQCLAQFTGRIWLLPRRCSHGWLAKVNQSTLWGTQIIIPISTHATHRRSHLPLGAYCMSCLFSRDILYYCYMQSIYNKWRTSSFSLTLQRK